MSGGLRSLTDEELVRRAQDDFGGPGGSAAASELLSRYRDRVYLWCLRRVRDPDRALDLAQDVLVNAFRGLPSFAGRSQFSSWLFAIARNRCMRAMRRPALVQCDDEGLDLVADPRPGPDEALETEEEQRLLLQLAVDHLEQAEGVALWLRCVEGMSVDDITRKLDIQGPSGARGVLQRARRKLQAALDRSKTKRESAP